MVQLNASTLPSVKMARGVAPKTERVIQFGEGGFLRAFCDWMIDMANEKAGMDAGVVIVQPIERGMVSMLNEQDGLYTLILRGQVDGKPSKDERIIQSVKRGLSPYEDFEGYLALAHNPDMRIIISNTTEAGIVYTGKDSFDDKPQASYPGKLTRLLYERFTAFGGKKGTGFILLPCELIDYNGRNLEECCLKTAEQWGLSEAFKTWLKEDSARLTDNSNSEEISAVTACGYDAYMAIYYALEKAQSTDGATLRDALAALDVPGLVTGDLKFDENGDAVKSYAIIKTATTDGFVFADSVTIE